MTTMNKKKIIQFNKGDKTPMGKSRYLNEKECKVVILAMKEIENELLLCYKMKHNKNLEDNPFRHCGHAWFSGSMTEPDPDNPHNVMTFYVSSYANGAKSEFTYNNPAGNLYVKWEPLIGGSFSCRVPKDAFGLEYIATMVEDCITAIRREFDLGPYANESKLKMLPEREYADTQVSCNYGFCMYNFDGLCRGKKITINENGCADGWLLREADYQARKDAGLPVDE